MFRHLFQGRFDAYGTNEGGCDRTPHGGEDEYARRILGHLMGTELIGVYPLKPDSTVHWGCVDLDGGTTDVTHARNLRAVLEQLGITAWIETSRSKGYHVWVFATEAVPATTMRNALLAACNIVDCPTDEVNPKQTDGAAGFGNYVRLPYGAAMTHGGSTWSNRQMMHGPDDTVRLLSWFVEEATAARATPDTLEAVAALYVPPPPKRSVVADGPSGPFQRAWVKQMGRPTYLAFTYGPREGHDRSSSLARLVHMLREDGFTAQQALAALYDADARWGKHHERGDQDEYLPQLINRIYG